MGSAASLALKLVLTPVLVGAASLAGRRWGSEIGGWLVGIPLTSGPIAFFLALNPGPRFAAAPVVGAHLAGLLAPFPLYAAVLATFAHRIGGVVPAVGVLRGLLLGLFSFACFFLTLAELLPGQSIAIAFVAAILVALVLQGASLALGRRMGLA